MTLEIDLKSKRNEVRVNRRGTAYVEYFLAAGAMALAATAMYAAFAPGFKISGPIKERADRQFQQLAGPLSKVSDASSASQQTGGGASDDGSTSRAPGGRPVLN